MRIRSRVKLATFLIISVVLVYSTFAVVINRTLEVEYRDSKIASGVGITFDHLQALTTDYVLYQTERAQQQWWTVHDELLLKLNDPNLKRFQQKYQVENLSDRLNLMGAAFTKLTATLGKFGLSSTKAEANEFQNRLITQIMVISREIGTSFDKLSENINANVVSLQRRNVWLNVIALLILILFILANSIFLSRSVVQPVLQLHEGAEIIGRGNLDYRMEVNGPGEIRELIQALNEMTANLMKVTVSRDDLATEMRERQQAQEALTRAHEELEQRVSERTGELRFTVAQLQEEVTERQRAEQALRESEQNLRDLASQILSAQEQERKRISMELHEGLGQSLTALKLHLRFIQQHLPVEEVKLKEEFDDARNLLKELIEEVRIITRGLSPAMLENIGLPAALTYLLDEFGKYQDLKITIDADKIEGLFTPQTEVNIFRIFQESLNNIAKHAQATQVSVLIKRQNSRVNFKIEDNGIGFNLAQVSGEKIAEKGMGLAAMDERLRMVGARLNILTQKDKGTEINFSIPVEENN